MQKIIFIVLLFLSMTSLAFAQNVVSLRDPVSSKNFNPEKYSSIRGTPFLFDKWLKGTITTPNGIYDNVELKFNAYDNTLFFNKEDEPFEFLDKIISFTLMPKEADTSSYLVFVNGVVGADLKGAEYVQVLLQGATSVYKLHTKQLAEMSEVNAGIVKTFSTNAKYYISKNNNLRFFRNNKSELLEILNDKKEKLQAYLLEHKLSLKKDTEVVELIKYYNTL